MRSPSRSAGLDRRSFLRRSALATAAAGAATSPFGALVARAGTTQPIPSPYGPVAPVADLSTGLELLALPQGFRYASFSWTGDPMSDGTACPSSHDGMAVVAQLPGRREELVLVRNHERGGSSAIGPAGVPTYDAASGGGTTNLRFARGQWLSDEVSLAGTRSNCAGGPTPWGSWLTCEETTAFAGAQHGYVFEVPGVGTASANPIVGMGRMAHEAVAVDPRNSVVYLTEDAGESSGFYRFVPNDANGRLGSLENGGTLQMCQAIGGPDLTNAVQGTSFPAVWVDIANPDQAPTGLASGPFAQGFLLGGTRFRRGEGCWWSEADQAIYSVSTSGGSTQNGAVFKYTPNPLDPGADGTLEAFFVADTAAESAAPDNITVSPRNGLLLCEDGSSNPERLMGLTPDACTFVFCENRVNLSAADVASAGKSVSAGNYQGSEFAGACFDPRGRYLFVNVQSPGITFAITGPWELGPL